MVDTVNLKKNNSIALKYRGEEALIVSHSHFL